MHKLPIVTYKFITPKTQKMNQGKLTNTYDFYHDGEFKNYLENEKEHPVNEERGYNSFNEYLSDHWTKENEKDRQHIPTFTNSAENHFKMAKNTIIYTGVISLPEDISEMGGFGDNPTKKKICDYYFNQFIKHHHFEKQDWCYYAAEHTNTKHTHMHIMIFQPNTVTGEKVMDYKIKSNCMTSRWVRTNTIRYVRSAVKTLNSELVQEFLETKHIMQKDFKREVKKQENFTKIRELANAINEVKGNSGKLQYKQLLHYSYLSDEQFERLDRKDKYITPQDSRMIINKIDKLSEYFIENNRTLKSDMKDINLMSEGLYPLDTEDRNVNYINKIDRERYENELKADLGNIILNQVKLDFGSGNYISQKKKSQKDCRSYKHIIEEQIIKTRYQMMNDFNKKVASARKSQEEQLDKYLEQLKQEEQEQEEKQERGIELAF